MNVWQRYSSWPLAFKNLWLVVLYRDNSIGGFR